MRRSTIQQVSQVSGNYKCYVESGCNYATYNYDILKKHVSEHKTKNNANKSKNFLYFGVMESTWSNIMPVSLNNVKIVSLEYMIENATTVKKLPIIIMNTINVIRVTEKSVYYEVTMFPDFERRIIWTPSKNNDNETAELSKTEREIRISRPSCPSFLRMSIKKAWLITISYSFAVVDTEISDLIPISLDPLRMVRGIGVGELFSAQTPESTTLVLLHTASVIKEESKCIYYKVYTFPEYDDRIIWYPKSDIEHEVLPDCKALNKLCDQDAKRRALYGRNDKFVMKIRGAYLLPNMDGTRPLWHGRQASKKTLLPCHYFKSTTAAIYSIIDIDMKATEAVEFITQKIINNNQIGNLFTNTAKPESLIFMVMDTLKFIGRHDSSLYFEIFLFPNYERRILQLPLDKFETLDKKDLLDCPLLIYQEHVRCMAFDCLNKLGLFKGAKIHPRKIRLT